jgi:hypothetical protein
VWLRHEISPFVVGAAALRALHRLSRNPTLIASLRAVGPPRVGVNPKSGPRTNRAGGSVLGYFLSENSQNSFPRLPVRENEPVLVWFAGFACLRLVHGQPPNLPFTLRRLSVPTVPPGPSWAG